MKLFMMSSNVLKIMVDSLGSTLFLAPTDGEAQDGAGGGEALGDWGGGGGGDVLMVVVEVGGFSSILTEEMQGRGA